MSSRCTTTHDSRDDPHRTTRIVGEGEGNVGVDLSYHNKEDETSKTSYFEHAWFKPIPIQENGQQVLWGLNYGMPAWRHGEEAMDPFHDEVSFLLWDGQRKLVMRDVVFGRGIAILAGSTAEPRDTALHFDAKPGAPDFGILQNPYLLERAEITDFTSVFTIEDEETFNYTANLGLTLAATGGHMQHTDENPLKLVTRIHPSSRIG